MRRRIFSLFLAMVMTLGLLPASAAAALADEEDAPAVLSVEEPTGEVSLLADSNTPAGIRQSLEKLGTDNTDRFVLHMPQNGASWAEQYWYSGSDLKGSGKEASITAGGQFRSGGTGGFDTDAFGSGVPISGINDSTVHHAGVNGGAAVRLRLIEESRTHDSNIAYTTFAVSTLVPARTQRSVQYTFSSQLSRNSKGAAGYYAEMFYLGENYSKSVFSGKQFITGDTNKASNISGAAALRGAGIASGKRAYSSNDSGVETSCSQNLTFANDTDAPQWVTSYFGCYVGVGKSGSLLSSYRHLLVDMISLTCSRAKDQPLVKAVASVDGKSYASISEALDALKSTSGGTLTLLQDIATAGSVSIGGSNVSVDLNGRKWTANNLTVSGSAAIYGGTLASGSSLLPVLEGKDITLRDLTLTRVANQNDGYAALVSVKGNGSTLQLGKNVKFDPAIQVYSAVRADDGAVVTLTGDLTISRASYDFYLTKGSYINVTEAVSKGYYIGVLNPTPKDDFLVVKSSRSLTGGWSIASAYQLVTKGNDLYAQIKPAPPPKTYNITLNPGTDGTLPEGSTAYPVTERSTYGDLPTPTPARAGISFQGWYTAQTGGSPVTAATTVTSSAPHTLYARWTQNPRFTVNFVDPTYGREASSRTYREDGSERYITSPYVGLPELYYPGSSFLGWFTEANGGTQVRGSELVTQSVTLYAHWEKTDFTVTLDAGEGRFGSGSSMSDTFSNTFAQLFDTNGQVKARYTPARENYTFTGWYVGDTKVLPTHKLTADTTNLTAKWSKSIYTVQYVSEGSLKKTVSVEGGEALEPVSITRKGYALKGWSQSKETGEPLWSFTDSVSGNMKLYAVWEEQRYGVTLDAGGGTFPGGVTPAVPDMHLSFAALFDENGQLKAEYIPTRAHFTFAGWYIGGSKVTRYTEVTDTTTLTAKWEPVKHEVLFSRNEIDGAPAGVYVPKYVNEGEPINYQPEWTNSKYKLIGWTTDAAGASKVWDIESDPVTEDLTLYALWAKVVTLDLGGGGTQEVTFPRRDGKVTYAELFGEDGEIKSDYVPAREGYDFAGWSEDGKNPVTAADEVNEYLKKLTPLWTGRNITVTFVLGEGTLPDGTAGTMTVTFGDTYGELPTPTRESAGGENFTFSGWYDAETGGSRVTKATLVQATEAHSLYGRWNASHTHGAVEYTRWNSTDSLPTGSGSYYLTEDITLTTKQTLPSGVTLCLNGHTITSKVAQGIEVSHMSSAVKFLDCSQSGVIKYEGDSKAGTVGIDIVQGSEKVTAFAMYDITIQGFETGVQIGGTGTLPGSFHMYGGTIKDTEIGVLTNCTTSRVFFNMSGGTITDNKTVGVKIDAGTFTMTGGTIRDNGTSTSDYGGVYIYYAAGYDAKFVMTGGTITGNHSRQKGSGVYFEGYAITLGGTAVIDGNTTGTGDDQTAGNLCLCNGKKIHFENSSNNPTFVDGAKIGVSRDEYGDINTPDYITVQIQGGTDLRAFFTADDDDYWINSETGGVKIIKKQHSHNVCGVTPCGHDGHDIVQFQPLPTLKSGANSQNEVRLDTGTYYLTDDIILQDTSASQRNFYVIDGDVTICLNGHTLKTVYTTVFKMANKATLTICDCKGGGQVLTVPSSIREYAAITTYGSITTDNKHNGTTVNLYGGAVRGIETTGRINLYGGTVTPYVYVGDKAVHNGFLGEYNGNQIRVGGAGILLAGATVDGGIYGYDADIELRSGSAKWVEPDKDKIAFNNSDKEVILTLGSAALTGNPAIKYKYDGYVPGTCLIDVANMTGGPHSLEHGITNPGEKGFVITRNWGKVSGGNPADYIYLTNSNTHIEEVTTDSGAIELAIFKGAPTANPGPDGPHAHNSCGESSCMHDGVTEQVYQPLTATGGNLSSGCYYLEDDLTLTDQLNIGNNTVYLCLNGHTLTCSKTTYPLYVKGGNLYICDCKGGGMIDGGTSAAVRTDFYTGSLFLYGGTVKGIYNSAGEINLYGGTVTVYNSGGDAIRRGASEDFCLDGATIEGRLYSDADGKIYLKSGSVKSVKMSKEEMLYLQGTSVAGLIDLSTYNTKAKIKEAVSLGKPYTVMPNYLPTTDNSSMASSDSSYNYYTITADPWPADQGVDAYFKLPEPSELTGSNATKVKNCRLGTLSGGEVGVLYAPGGVLPNSPLQEAEGSDRVIIVMPNGDNLPFWPSPDGTIVKPTLKSMIRGKAPTDNKLWDPDNPEWQDADGNDLTDDMFPLTVRPGQLIYLKYTYCTHDWQPEGEAVTGADCRHSNSQTVRCSICGLADTRCTGVGPHDFNEDQWVTGDSAHWHACRVCQAPAHVSAHDLAEADAPGSETAPGANYKYYTCATCGWGGYIDSAQMEHIHDYSVPNNTGDANTHGFMCVCGEEDPDSAHTAEHDFSDRAEITLPPTEDNPGELTKYCECGAAATEPIPALGSGGIGGGALGEDTYEVLFDLGLPGDIDGLTPPESLTKKTGDSFVLPGVSGERLGYSFSGWLSVDADGEEAGGAPGSSFTMPGHPVVFMGQWSRLTGGTALNPGDKLLLDDGTVIENGGGQPAVITVDRDGDGTPEIVITLPGGEDSVTVTPTQIGVDTDGDGEDDITVDKEIIGIPGGTAVETHPKDPSDPDNPNKDGATTTVGGNGGTVDLDGNVTAGPGTEVEDSDGGKVTITEGTGEIDPGGTVTFPDGGKVTTGDGEEIEIPKRVEGQEPGYVMPSGEFRESGEETVGRPIIDTGSLPGTGKVDTPYSGRLTAEGTEPVTWAADGLPPGLTLGEDGTISGTPTTPGTYTVRITATDKNGSEAETEITITVESKSDPEPAGWVRLEPDDTVTAENGTVVKRSPGGTELTVDKDGDGEPDVFIDVPSDGEVLVNRQTGEVKVPDGSTVIPKGGGPEMKLPGGGTVDPDGGVTPDGGGSVVVGGEDGKPEVTVTPPAAGDDGGRKVTPNPDGTVTVPDNTTVKPENGPEIRLPEGGAVNPGGENGGGTDITPDGGKAVIPGGDGKDDISIEVPAGGDGKVTVTGGGEVEVPGGTTVKPGGENGPEIKVPTGGKVDPDSGSVTGGTVEVNDTAITPPTNKDSVTTDRDGNTPVGPGSTASRDDVTVEVVTGSGIVDRDGNVTFPDGGGTVEITKDGHTSSLDIPQGGSVPTDGDKLHDVSGEVNKKDEDNQFIPVNSAAVELRQGIHSLAITETDSKGAFTFYNIPNGAYNIVATERDTGKTKTQMVTLSSTDEALTLTMPGDNVNSVLNVVESGTSSDSEKPAAAVEKTVVGGLDEEAEAVKDENPAAAKVTVTMTVEKKDSSAEGASDIQDEALPGANLEFLAIRVEKAVDDEEPEEISLTSAVIELVIPFSFARRSNVAVYRYHDSEAAALDQLGSRPSNTDRSDGTFWCDTGNGLIHIYAQKFSTYAIGYTQDEDEPAPPAHIHVWDTAWAANATHHWHECTGDCPITSNSGKDGYAAHVYSSSQDATCSTCGYTRQAAPAESGGSSSTAYTPAVSNPEHGKVTVSPKNPERGDKVTITLTPDGGYKADGLTVTDRNGKPVEVTENGDGTYSFTQPAGAVTVTASFVRIQEEPAWTGCPKDLTCPISAFPDAVPTAWYHDGVHYCLENRLMNGYDTGMFGPDDFLSRAQLARILWNLAGQPAVTGESGFPDVAPDAWYARAVTWARQNGVINGYSDGRFGPDDLITREQLAAMLWRYAGSPAATGTGLAFSDAGSISAYADSAVLWALGTEIVRGYPDATLAPKGTASRAEAAVMLQRFCTILKES